MSRLGFPFPMRRGGSVAVALAAVATLHVVGAAPEPSASSEQSAPSEQSASSAEVRALWVTRSTLTTPAAVRQMVQAAQDGGFNTLVVQVRGRGDAYYRSTIEPRASEIGPYPDFDPLQETLTLARRAGVRVHAWVAVNLISSAVALPGSRQHIIYRRPEWLMVPRAIAAEMRGIDPRSPEYLGRLVRWTRANRDEVEGLYASPVHPAAAAHVVRVVADLVTRYDIDGVHLDYVRYPNDQFDYSRATLQQFKLTVRPQLPEPERRAADAQDAIDPLAYPSLFPDRWVAFRQSRLTTLVMRIRTAIKAVRPEILLSAAVVPDAGLAASTRLQDWRTWLDQSLIDVLCPMAYTQDLQVFEQQVASARDFAGGVPVWAGVGAYRLTRDATLSHIAAARRQRAAGVILFSYDALVAPPNSLTTLAELARAAFGSGSH